MNNIKCGVNDCEKFRRSLSLFNGEGNEEHMSI
jgi:hypothetical protein